MKKHIGSWAGKGLTAFVVMALLMGTLPVHAVAACKTKKVTAVTQGAGTSKASCKKKAVQSSTKCGKQPAKNSNKQSVKDSGKQSTKKSCSKASEKKTKATSEKNTAANKKTPCPAALNNSCSTALQSGNDTCASDMPSGVLSALGQFGLTTDSNGNLCYQGNCSQEEVSSILSQFQNICGNSVPSVIFATIQPPKTTEQQPTTNPPKAPEALSTMQPQNTPAASIPAANTSQSNSSQSIPEQITALVNEERAKVGLSPVTLDAKLTGAANIRAKEIEQSFAHTRPDGRSFSTVFADQGINYRGCGENIAWGQRSATEVMNGWMNSKGHRANILNRNFVNIGVGYYQDAKGINHWVQLFSY